MATSEGKAGTVSVTVTCAPPRLGCGLALDQFALIAPGSFQMGSNTGRPDEMPVHSVTISHAFYMQKTEVTQGQWRALMHNNPSYSPLCGDTCPVDQVPWDDIQLFLQLLNASTPGVTYRLPTEAEWEYAARAGTTGDTYGTLDAIAWHALNSNGTMHPVAGKQANAWGLYDMLGNAIEWVNDWYSANYYAVSPSTDPPGPSSGSVRVLRGGSRSVDATFVGSPFRLMGFALPVAPYDFGFRLARTP